MNQLENQEREISDLVDSSKFQRLQKKYPEASALLETAEKLLTAHPECTLAKISLLIERAHHFIFEHTPARARVLLKEAWPLSINQKTDHYTVEIAQMMASIEPMKSKEAWLRMAIEFAEDSGQDKAKEQLEGLYSTLGWMQFDLKQFESALETFRKAVNRSDSLASRWAFARTLRELGRVDEALHQQSALLMGLELKFSARVTEEIGECLLALNRVSEAEMFFRRAYDLMSSPDWVPDGRALSLPRLRELGKIPKIKHGE